jgi:hypothetical protein
VRFDKTIATLQKNVLNWKKLSNAKEEETKAREEEKMESINVQNKKKKRKLRTL